LIGKKTRDYAFQEIISRDDEQFLNQIVKDLHRTGSEQTSTADDRHCLQRVLLGFARYNKSIGYCQGLHILTSVILDVVHRNEDEALIILIYLIDHCLPNLFSKQLDSLAIDLAVFDQWLKIDQPILHEHLRSLRTNSMSQDLSILDEPPLLNVFTIQWFLTIFTTCLPRETTVRIWDVLMIEGSEVLFRTALVLWSKLSLSILKVSTADQFYSTMAHLSAQLLDETMIVADQLIRDIYHFGPFPTRILAELRQKFSSKLDSSSQSISSASKSKDIKRIASKLIDEDLMNFVSCFALLSSSSTSRIDPLQFMSNKSLSNDLNQLRQEYKQLQQRNQQIHIFPPRFHQSTTVPDAPKTINNKTPINHLMVRSTETTRSQLKKPASTPSMTKSVQSTDENIMNRLINKKCVQTPRYSSFNPFPSRSFNENVAVNGYKLGLYSPVLTTR